MLQQKSGAKVVRSNGVKHCALHGTAITMLCLLASLSACSAPDQTPATASAGGAQNGNLRTGEAGAAEPSEPDWCAASAVLRAKCQRCHTEPLENGAPFPLLTYADTQVVDKKGSLRSDKMQAALEADYMPPRFLELTPAVEPLSDGERSTLLTWLSGQPPADAQCE